MNARLSTISAISVGIALASCVPIEDPRIQQGPPQQQELTPEQTRLQELEKQRLAEAEAELIRQQNQFENGGNQNTGLNPVGPTDYPFASKVPGKEGFVFSPYNKQVVDVRDIPSGTLVQDPTYPASEKKYFRVP